MPLSDAQKNLHWGQPDGWGRVCAQNKWRMVKGRLDIEAIEANGSEFHGKVWAFAEAIALKNNRAVTPDDLRKGTYTFALGTAKSLTKFENADLDRVLLVFQLLIEPDNLSAVKDWLAYEKFDKARAEIERCRKAREVCNVTLPDDPGERRRHLHFINQNPQGVIKHLVRQRFAGVLPEDMPLSDLRDFSKTLKNRRAYENRPVQPNETPVAIEEELPDEMVPF